MNIKTWQERVKPEYHSLNIARDSMQAEIDELRVYVRQLEDETTPAFSAQRVVLEQALEALKTCLQVDQQWQVFDYEKIRAAITAIQGVLKS